MTLQAMYKDAAGPSPIGLEESLVPHAHGFFRRLRMCSIANLASHERNQN